MTIRRPVAVRGDPVDSVVELLEALLADARAGQIVSFVAAYETDGGGTSHGWAWGKGAGRCTLLGEMERAKHRMLKQLDE